MALLKVFAVYDSKLAAFFHPFFAAHAALAKRSFHTVANDKNTQICGHPEDFTLFEIGEWNDESGEFSSYPKHINHGLAAIYKVRELDHAQEHAAEKRDAAPVQPSSKGGNSAKQL